jgi:hypothetical protein
MVMHGHESAMLAIKRNQPWVGLRLIDLQHLLAEDLSAAWRRSGGDLIDGVGLGLALWLKGDVPAKGRAPGQ